MDREIGLAALLGSFHEQREVLDRQIKIVSELLTNTRRAGLSGIQEEPKKPKKRQISAEGLANIRAGVKRRWAAARKKKKAAAARKPPAAKKSARSKS